MTKNLKKLLFVPLSLLLSVFLLFSMIGCNTNEEEAFKADITITIVNANNEPIVDTFVSAMNVNNTDLPVGKTTDSNGQFTLKNLTERELTFVIHGEETSYNTKYTISKTDLEQGSITVQFSNITETTIKTAE